MYVCGFMCLCVYMHTQAFMSVSCACLWLYIVLECVFVNMFVCLWLYVCVALHEFMTMFVFVYMLVGL